jgi:hypothetical protein
VLGRQRIVRRLQLAMTGLRVLPDHSNIIGQRLAQTDADHERLTQKLARRIRAGRPKIRLDAFDAAVQRVLRLFNGCHAWCRGEGVKSTPPKGNVEKSSSADEKIPTQVQAEGQSKPKGQAEELHYAGWLYRNC